MGGDGSTPKGRSGSNSTAEILERDTVPPVASETEASSSRLPNPPHIHLIPTTPTLPSHPKSPRLSILTTPIVTTTPPETSPRDFSRTTASDLNGGDARRRLSNAAQHPVRRKRGSVDHPLGSSPPGISPSSPRKTKDSWFNLIPSPRKVSKSDGEGEDDWVSRPKRKHRHLGMASLNEDMSLPPLPQDPNNLLPLSLPSTPFSSPPASRHVSPNPSNLDLAAEYSPRTSTSSSRPAWSHGTRSDSRSSAEDESSPTFTHPHGWWGRHHGPVSPKIIAPPRRRVTSRPMDTWLPWLSSRPHEKIRTRYREKGTLRTRPVMGSKWLGRAWAFVPTNFTSFMTFLILFSIFAFTLTITLKHILNPDKEPLPWRQYCTSPYPTLHSLQDPNSVPGLTRGAFTSTLGQTTFPLNSFAPSSSNLILAPLTPEHPTWPYRPHTTPPYNAETGDLADLDPVGILIGVFTTDAGAQRRHMIRESYASHWRSRRQGTEGVRVRFVMGRPRPKYAQAIQLEMEAFNDIILLDMPENMNSGKTHAFFTWAAENATVPDWDYSDVEPVWRGEKKPDYVVKADEDSFIMLGELERRLRVVPRTKTYWGYLVKNWFMAGECYALSLDLVRYIAASPALRTLTRGKEDKLVARWMNMHPERESIVWVAEKCWIYDHPKAGTVYSHGFLYPSTVSQIRDNSSLHTGDRAHSYSTVSKFGTRYRPFAEMSATEQVEALVEGSSLSKIRDESRSPDTDAMREKIQHAYTSRPTRKERFLGDEQERGGTVVVHYIKKQDWFVETMVAMLGTADEQSGPSGRGPRGYGTGLGATEYRGDADV